MQANSITGTKSSRELIRIQLDPPFGMLQPAVDNRSELERAFKLVIRRRAAAVHEGGRIAIVVFPPEHFEVLAVTAESGRFVLRSGVMELSSRRVGRFRMVAIASVVIFLATLRIGFRRSVYLAALRRRAAL